MSSLFKPPEKSSLKIVYDSKVPSFKQLIDEVCFTLKQNMKSEKIELSGEIQHRIKDFESLYNKIIRHELNANFFDKIADVAGIRIVCLYRTDLERIGKIIHKNFEVIETDIKTEKTPFSEFGYMADHYVVKLSPSFSGPRYDSIKSVCCEIQVRTVLMDAWDSISHHLDYKQEIDIPSHLRRDFYALSGLFYVADTHFEMFRDSVDALKQNIKNEVKKDNFSLVQEMNLTSLQAYLEMKFPKRPHLNSQVYSQLLAELQDTGYSSFEKLDRALESAIPAAELYEKQNKLKINFVDAGFVRVCLLLCDDTYVNYYEKKFKNRFDINLFNYRKRLITQNHFHA